jgi:serine/threonine protein phosphatase PrpC
MLEPSHSQRHIVTRSIQGDDSNPIADFYEAPLILNDDSFLVCSDGFPVQQIYSSVGSENIMNSLQNLAAASRVLHDLSVAFIARQR